MSALSIVDVQTAEPAPMSSEDMFRLGLAASTGVPARAATQEDGQEGSRRPASRPKDARPTPDGLITHTTKIISRSV